MQYNIVPNTNLKVSKIRLGTMTFGQQNSEEDGHLQLDYALDQGINFIDTAELYPIPRNASTQGNTDRIIGTWLKKNKNRDQVIIASKVVGPAQNLSHISDHLGFSKNRILDALEKGLRRLQTDYIDIFQWHWPERQTNMFGVRGYQVHDDQWQDNFEEGVATMNALIQEGKIRHWGISNETPWGVMRINEICTANGYNRPITIQNPYNLLNRSFETGLSEICMRNDLKLLAYSPLAFGLLTGKYHQGHDQPEDRLNQFPSLSRYNSDNAKKATGQYLDIASKYQISPTLLALAFVNSRPWVISNIIGATSISQLIENIKSIEIKWTKEMEEDVNIVHNMIPDPAP